ncbi:hypothetical protein ml_244 [Mollivirus sibericum]|uniref:hypothetical protein n=1 Tax=Mollivirus sibericum TaxID=1678078 RepID=UPI0006B2D9A1|nr:hypothetical protein ml_244 [Mollivirus sibericum]ALD62046.1 hypothetical protein ml_244 [Mollivirus sibericum]
MLAPGGSARKHRHDQDCVDRRLAIVFRLAGSEPSETFVAQETLLAKLKENGWTPRCVTDRPSAPIHPLTRLLRISAWPTLVLGLSEPAAAQRPIIGWHRRSSAVGFTEVTRIVGHVDADRVKIVTGLIDAVSLRRTDQASTSVSRSGQSPNCGKDTRGRATFRADSTCTCQNRRRGFRSPGHHS